MWHIVALIVAVVSSCGAIPVSERAATLDVAAASPDDMCTQKQQAKVYCFPGGNFSEALCGQQVVTQWLDQYNQDAIYQAYLLEEAQWGLSTNVTNDTQANLNVVSANVSQWMLQAAIEALRFPPTRYDALTNDLLTRITAINALCNTDEMTRQITLNSKLASDYSSMRACLGEPINKCLVGEDQFTAELVSQMDYNVLKEVWLAYYNASIPFRAEFTERMNLLNKGARENGWPDNGYFEWFTDVWDNDFIAKMEQLLTEIHPLYVELHAYVRYKLLTDPRYTKYLDPKGPIPIHLTGDLFGQTWSKLISLVKPFPEFPDTDVTPAMVAQNYTTQRMFEMAQEFFTSIDCFPMTQTFWNKSMLEQPADRIVECHGSAEDFQINDDYRIKMCTRPTMDFFGTVHHEMGHVEYFTAYRPLRYVYRNGAQSGFHEAIGDTIMLSALTPEHLHTVGLLPDVPTAPEFDINFLMTTALQKIPFFSFALLVDWWRWGTYNETITADKYNQEWWQKRLELGGVVPPTDRNSEMYMDPAAKFHVANNVPYIRYFMSFFLQFQFYESMCKEKNHTGNLHRCDFYQSKKAGDKLKQMLSHGSNMSWHDQLEMMTGSREVNSSSILSYFSPLQKWLKDYNDQHDVYRGWTVTTPTVPTGPTATSSGPTLMPGTSTTPNRDGSTTSGSGISSTINSTATVLAVVFAMLLKLRN